MASGSLAPRSVLLNPQITLLILKNHHAAKKVLVGWKVYRKYSQYACTRDVEEFFNTTSIAYHHNAISFIGSG